MARPHWYGSKWPPGHPGGDLTTEVEEALGPQVAVARWFQPDPTLEQGSWADQEDIPPISIHPDGEGRKFPHHHQHHFIPIHLLLTKKVLTRDIAHRILQGTLIPTWRQQALTELAATHNHSDLVTAWLKALYHQNKRLEQRGFDHVTRLIDTLAKTERFDHPDGPTPEVPLTPNQFLIFVLDGVWVMPEAVRLRSYTMISGAELPTHYRQDASASWPLRTVKAQPRRKWLARLPDYYVHAVVDALHALPSLQNSGSAQDEDLTYYNRHIRKQEAEFSMPRQGDLDHLHNLYIADNLLAVVTEQQSDDNTATQMAKPDKNALRIATLNMGSVILHK